MVNLSLRMASLSMVNLSMAWRVRDTITRTISDLRRDIPNPKDPRASNLASSLGMEAILRHRQLATAVRFRDLRLHLSQAMRHLHHTCHDRLCTWDVPWPDLSPSSCRRNHHPSVMNGGRPVRRLGMFGSVVIGVGKMASMFGLVVSG